MIFHERTREKLQDAEKSFKKQIYCRLGRLVRQDAGGSENIYASLKDFEEN